MNFDLIPRNLRIAGGGDAVRDIGIIDGHIAAVAPELEGDGPERDLGGRLVTPGLVETHLHLDKSGLTDRRDRGGGTLAEAVAAVAAAKRGFTEDDVHARASATLEKAIPRGTTRLRTHVEVDPRVGLTSLASCLEMITREPARLMRLADYGVAPGRPADIVVLDCRTEAQAIAELAPAMLGYKRGRQSFSRPAAELMRPGGASSVPLGGKTL